MEANKTTFNDTMSKAEDISDKAVKMIYKKWIIEKIESNELMKKLINSSFVNGIQNFWKGWFGQIFVILGYITIVSWFLLFLSSFSFIFTSYYLSLTYITWLIFSIIYSILTIIMWFWMIKFKSWFPYIALLQYWAYLLSIILSTLFISVIVSFAIFVVYFALILKNKKVFDWAIKNDSKEEVKKEVVKEEVVKEEKKVEKEKREF